MGFGLGKNSPIILSLGKGNYEAMLDRHGQNVRWRIAKKCTCITANNQPDIHCPLCNGHGELYDFQKEYTDTLRIRVTGGYVELPVENAECEVIKAVDSKGVELYFEQSGRFVRVSHPFRVINNGEIIEIVIKQSITTKIESAILEPIGGGFYRVPQAQSNKSNIEGVTYTSAGDIIKIEKVLDANGVDVLIKEFRRDTLYVEQVYTEPLTASGIEYIKPFKFFVLSQDLNKADQKIMDRHSGDAVCTFPYRYDVAENDIITVLSGSQTHKTVIKRASGNKDDVIHEFFVESVPYLAADGKEYKEGGDFVIIGENKIHWLCDTPPAAGENISIIYRYNPSYRVFMNIPMLRTSEDQRIPRKVILKLLSSFSESRRVQVA